MGPNPAQHHLCDTTSVCDHCWLCRSCCTWSRVAVLARIMIRAGNDPSWSFTITEQAPTFKNLLRHNVNGHLNTVSKCEIWTRTGAALWIYSASRGLLRALWYSQKFVSSSNHDTWCWSHCAGHHWHQHWEHLTPGRAPTFQSENNISICVKWRHQSNGNDICKHWTAPSSCHLVTVTPAQAMVWWRCNGTNNIVSSPLTFHDPFIDLLAVCIL